MQCRDVRELADSFLSDQLLVETNHQLVRHLETCPDCRAEIGRPAYTQRTRCVPRGTRSDELGTSAGVCRGAAATLRPSRPVTSRSLLQSWWAMAAGVVLAAGGGVLVRDARRRDRLGRARARRGWRSSELRGQVQPGGASDLSRGSRPAATARRTARWRRSSRRRATELDTLERHACVYQGRRFGTLSIATDGRSSSLLVTDARPRRVQTRAERRPAPGRRRCRPGASSVSSWPISIASESCSSRRHCRDR